MPSPQGRGSVLSLSPCPAPPHPAPCTSLGFSGIQATRLSCSPVTRHSGASQLPHMFCFPCRGDVTWDCVKTQLSEAAVWVWLRLQDITMAFLDWALAMISQQ